MVKCWPSYRVTPPPVWPDHSPPVPNQRYPFWSWCTVCTAEAGRPSGTAKVCHCPCRSPTPAPTVTPVASTAFPDPTRAEYSRRSLRMAPSAPRRFPRSNNSATNTVSLVADVHLAVISLIVWTVYNRLKTLSTVVRPRSDDSTRLCFSRMGTICSSYACSNFPIRSGGTQKDNRANVGSSAFAGKDKLGKENTIIPTTRWHTRWLQRFIGYNLF